MDAPYHAGHAAVAGRGGARRAASAGLSADHRPVRSRRDRRRHDWRELADVGRGNGVADPPSSQYADDANLRARQRLWEHQEPAFDVVSWAIELAGVTSGMRVLDLGCGNGRYLRSMAALGVNTIGVDVSLGMLASCLAGHLVAADAVELPFPKATFDTVLAPHMLYHVSDRSAAARELRRVLRRGGMCVAVTNGVGHLASLRDLVEKAVRPVAPGWQWADPLARAFSLENGVEQLSLAFDDVRCLRPSAPARAVVTDAGVAADYVASVADLYGPQIPLAWDRVVEGVREHVSRHIAADGQFVIEGDVGALVCR